MEKKYSIACFFQAFIAISSAMLLSADIVSAQPAYSRGEQRLPITYDVAMQRAKAALIGEGYVNLNEGGAFVAGFKEIHTAVIMCNVAPDATTWINIVVASNNNDATVPGGERVRLQNRMNQAKTADGLLLGEWNLKCCNDGLSWTMSITSQNGVEFSGSLSEAHSGGNITNGVVTGNTIEFVRSGSWGKQKWTAQLVNEGGSLRMVNGVWTGDYQDRYAGQNNWHAEKK